jgi:hypothetical protein
MHPAFGWFSGWLARGGAVARFRAAVRRCRCSTRRRLRPRLGRPCRSRPWLLQIFEMPVRMIPSIGGELTSCLDASTFRAISNPGFEECWRAHMLSSGAESVEPIDLANPAGLRSDSVTCPIGLATASRALRPPNALTAVDFRKIAVPLRSKAKCRMQIGQRRRIEAARRARIVFVGRRSPGFERPLVVAGARKSSLDGPLMLAVLDRNANRVKALLLMGANPNAPHPRLGSH